MLFLLAVPVWAEPFLVGGRRYGPQGTEARRVTLDRQGFVWVSGDKGTFRFDGVRYLSASRLGLPVHSETRIAVTSAPGEANGTVWAQSEWGLYRLESGRFERVDEANKGLPPVAAAGELLYAALAPNGLKVWYREGAQKSVQWRSATTSIGPPAGLLLHGEPDGRVWFGDLSANHWVRWNGGGFEHGTGILSRDLPSRPSRMSRESATGAPLGSRALNGDSREFRYEVCGVWASPSAAAMRLPGAREVTPDFYSGLWGARGEQGLIFAGRLSLIKMLSHSLLPDRPVRSVARHGERLYLARTDITSTWEAGPKAARPAKLCDQTNSQEALLESWGLPEARAPYVDVDVDPDGSVWVLARNHGAIHLRADGTFIEAAPEPAGQPLFFPTMREMTISSDGRLWIASKNNLIEVLRKPALRYRSVFVGKRYTSGFVRDREGHLFAITEGGFLLYEGGEWRQNAWPHCMLSPNVRTVAVASPNQHWIGYRDRNGFTRAIRSPGGEWQCQQFEPADGFPGDTQFLAFDRQRRLWRGSEAGLFVARETPLAVKDWVRLGADVGIPAGEMHQLFHQEPDGTVMVSIGDQLVRIPPRLLERDPGVAPQVSYLETGGHLVLNPLQVDARLGDGGQLYLSSLPERELAAAAPVEYRYDGTGRWAMLSGHRLALDESPTAARRVEFRYVGATATLSLPLRMDVPWWLTRWFRSTAGVTGLAALGGLGVWIFPLLRRRRFQASKRRYLARHPEPVHSVWPNGTLLRDRYRVDGLLARGGFSDVFAATDKNGMRVVVKRLRQGNLPVDALRRRFTQEVAAVSMIRHPGVLPILDTWIDASGIPHLVLERVDGPTLRQRLNDSPFERTEARALLRDLAGILAAAHAQGVVHSDLKPENILLLDGGKPVVIDFGTSALHMQAPLSEYSRPAGSVQYMAPEQLLGRYSRATDVYAFALLSLEILTGRRYAEFQLPFDDRWEAALILAMVDDLGFSPTAAAVFAQGLRFDPQQRAQDLAAWHAGLESAL